MMTFVSQPSKVLVSLFCVVVGVSSIVQAQYYAPGVGAGCVVTGKKLFSHGNYIRDLTSMEQTELDKYRKEATEFRQKVDEAYANMESMMRSNGTLPSLPNRPTMPAFCSGPDTTLYILGGCTVQNNKVYIAGKYARELNEMEKEKLEEFSKQMVAQNLAAMAAANATAQQHGANNGTAAATSSAEIQQATQPQATTVSPVNEMGRQIALEFCTEF